MSPLTRRSFLGGLLGAGAGLLATRCFDELGGRDRWDVVVVGSGPAGLLVALPLARSGLSVLVVESGPRHPSADPRWATLDAYVSRGEIPYPAASTRERGAGGTTSVWTGHCPRLHPRDLAPNAYTPRECPWPLSYADLAPFYLAAEAALDVQGAGGAELAPPRRSPYPVAVDPRRDLSRLAPRLAAAGLSVEPLPLAVVGDGPLRLAKTYVPQVETAAGAELVCGATVTDLVTGGAGRIAAVEARDLGGRVRTLAADRFVLAAGGLETPRLLLANRDLLAPRGGGGAALAGRFFMEHLVIAGKGRLAGLWDPASPELRSAITYQYLAAAKQRGLGDVMVKLYQTAASWPGARASDSELTLQAEVEMEPRADNRLDSAAAETDRFGRPGVAVSLSPSPRDHATIGLAREIVRGILQRAGASRIEMTDEVSWAHHHLGACRMGDDPATSVVDGDLRVHGTKNLYVTGSAVFPTGGASSPTLTIAALSLRLAAHLLAGRGGSTAAHGLLDLRPEGGTG